MVKNSQKNKIIFGYLFPKKLKNINKTYLVTIGIGGNIGNTILRFKIIYKLFQKNHSFKLVKTSIILKNPPFGYLKQNDFYNTIFLIKTDYKPKKVLKILQSIENRFKRKRDIKNGPRTIDLDIIFIKQGSKDMFLNNNNLTIPHPKWFERDSVLIPLQYMKD